LLPDAVAEPLLATTDIVDLGILPDTNHWSITFAREGAATTAALIEKPPELGLGLRAGPWLRGRRKRRDRNRRSRNL